ncbi:MAG: glycoside hydrolase family 5 protein [Lachnospiraceae bacterium]
MRKIFIQSFIAFVFCFCLLGNYHAVYATEMEEDSSAKFTLTGNYNNYVCAITPVKMHGRLSVSGTNIVDANGKVTQLRGVSLHGIQHTNGSTTAFKDYVNYSAFRILRDEWGVNMIRIPVYTNEGGYCQGNSAAMDATIQSAVSYATQLGMYIIIDWHILSDGNPQTYQNQAISFFSNYANKYKNNNNVIYEICNEPNGVDWTTVKAYAVPVIKTIRSYDKNALIVVGTPQWSQLPTWGGYSAADNPITSQDIGGSGTSLAKNVLYSIHFYAATHYSDIQSNVTYAHNKGLPIFCTEFGISDASGNGNVDVSNANTWMNLFKQYHISFACWNLSNNNETSAMLKTSCTKLYGWKNEDLTTSGTWFVNTVRPMYDQEMANYNPNMYNGVDYSAVYDYTYYCNKYPALKEKFGSDKKAVLRHFVLYGMKEGRQAIASFNVKSYANKYYGLRKLYKNDLPKYYLHYIKFGKAEGRVATGVTIMQGGPTVYNGKDYKDVFRVGFYAYKYPKLKELYGFDDAKYLAHFVKIGMAKGFQGSTEFNVNIYRKRYPRLVQKYGSDLPKYYLHYINYGKAHNYSGK